MVETRRRQQLTGAYVPKMARGFADGSELLGGAFPGGSKALFVTNIKLLSAGTGNDRFFQASQLLGVTSIRLVGEISTTNRNLTFYFDSGSGNGVSANNRLTSSLALPLSTLDDGANPTHVVAFIDLDNDAGMVWVDGVEDPAPIWSNTGPQTTFRASVATTLFQPDADASKAFNGELGGLFVGVDNITQNATVQADLDEIIAMFWANGAPKDPASLGLTWQVAMNGNATDWNYGVNAGALGNFDLVSNGTGRGFEPNYFDDELAWRPVVDVAPAVLDADPADGWLANDATGVEAQADWPAVGSSSISVANATGGGGGMRTLTRTFTSGDDIQNNKNWPLWVSWFITNAGNATRYIRVRISHDVAGGYETVWEFNTAEYHQNGHAPFCVIPAHADALTVPAGAVALGCTITAAAAGAQPYDPAQDIEQIVIEYEQFTNGNDWYSPASPSKTKGSAFLGIYRGMGHTPVILFNETDGGQSCLTALEPPSTGDSVSADFAAAGIRPTMFWIPSGIGTGTHIDLADVPTLRNDGWIFCTHSGDDLHLLGVIYFDFLLAPLTVGDDYYNDTNGSAPNFEVAHVEYTTAQQNEGYALVYISSGTLADYTAGDAVKNVVGDVLTCRITATGIDNDNVATDGIPTDELATITQHEYNLGVAAYGSAIPSMRIYANNGGSYRAGVEAPISQNVRDSLVIAGMSGCYLSVGAWTFPPISYDSPAAALPVYLEAYAIGANVLTAAPFDKDLATSVVFDARLAGLVLSGGSQALTVHAFDESVSLVVNTMYRPQMTYIIDAYAAEMALGRVKSLNIEQLRLQVAKRWTFGSTDLDTAVQDY